MKPAVLFLSGLSAVIAGAFIRSCQPATPFEQITSICGPALHDTAIGFHQHCAGCVTMFAGAVAMLAATLAPALHSRRTRVK